MAKVQWPTSPNIGDKVYASRGGAWIWDGCGWTHTCCVEPACDIRGNGLNVCISILDQSYGNYLSLPITKVICLNYEGDDVWRSDGVILDKDLFTYFTVKFEYGQWIFGVEGPTLTIASLNSSDPIGDWQVANIFDANVSVTSSCGCDIPICIKASKSGGGWEYQTTFFPLRDYAGGTPDGAIQAYGSIFGFEFLIVPYNGEWYLIYKDYELFAYLPGVYPDPPVGSWTLLAYSPGGLIVTEAGGCPCDPTFAGISLQVGISGPGNPSSYTNLNYVNSTLYDSVSPGLYLSYSGGVWNLYVSGVIAATLSGTSPLGVWTDTGMWPEGFPPRTAITTSCGASESNQGCLAYMTSSSPGFYQNQYFTRVSGDSGELFYMNLGESPYSISPGAPGVWEVMDSDNLIVATANAPHNEPPFGLTWTIADPSIVAIQFDATCKTIEPA